MIPNTGWCRRGLTLAELLIAMAITTMVVGALSAFTHAVMDGYKQTNQAGNAAQSARVVLSRVGHAVATSRQVLVAPPGVVWPNAVKNCLIVWERDGEPSDPAHGEPNWAEVVIYARSRKNPANMLELRPTLDPSLVVPLYEPTMMKYWVLRFRNELDVQQPPVVLLDNAGGLKFEVAEYTDPQGIADMTQQDVRVRLCISPKDERPTAFFGSATRRFLPGNFASDSLPVNF